ncbi:hypothetical protein [Spirosoma luteum]|uniref:hypothetical protein n=1 Tax=Spirosoma luteum TaxID=431553 RepID=UPI0003829ABF|nr:hypothetical protein [Spirosoma luteum]
MHNLYLATFLLLFVSGALHAQTPPARPTASTPPVDLAERIRLLEENLRFANQSLAKSVDDLLWYQKLGDVAIIDKVRYDSKPPHIIKNPTGQGASNPVVIPAYTFVSKKFEYKIYQDAPGGHSFNRLDTKLARDSREDIYRFLARYLSPPAAIR